MPQGSQRPEYQLHYGYQIRQIEAAEVHGQEAGRQKVREQEEIAPGHKCSRLRGKGLFGASVLLLSVRRSHGLINDPKRFGQPSWPTKSSIEQHA
jgi:hypothetical protein